MLAGHPEVFGSLRRSYLVYQLILAQFIQFVRIEAACVAVSHLKQQLAIIVIVREEAGKVRILDINPSAVHGSPVLLPGNPCAGGAVAYGYPLGLNCIAARVEPAHRKGFGHGLILLRFHRQFDGVVRFTDGGGFTVYRGACRVVIGLNKLGDGFAFAITTISEPFAKHIPHGAVGIAAVCPGLSIEYHPVVCRGSVGKLYSRVGGGDVYIEGDPVEMIDVFIVKPLYQPANLAGLRLYYNVVPLILYLGNNQAFMEVFVFIVAAFAFIEVDIEVLRVLQEFQVFLYRSAFVAKVLYLEIVLCAAGQIEP